MIHLQSASPQILLLALYNVHLACEDEPVSEDNPIYIAIDEETIGNHTITYEERKEWKYDEIETFRSMPIVENFLHQSEQSP